MIHDFGDTDVKVLAAPTMFTAAYTLFRNHVFRPTNVQSNLSFFQHVPHTVHDNSTKIGSLFGAAMVMFLVIITAAVRH
jgi:hypothetical protein